MRRSVYGVFLLVVIAGCGSSSSSATGTGTGTGAGTGAASAAGQGAGGASSNAGTSGSAGSNTSHGGNSVGGLGGEAGSVSGGGGNAVQAGAGNGSANPSCQGLAATCGSMTNADCCASSVVPGGSFQRNNVAPPGPMATVSDFRLDIYDVTVARFRKFLAVYPGSKPSAGTGKNPKNSADMGWDPAWDASLPADQAALLSAVQCADIDGTFTPAAGANETLPVNCADWYEAFAFCIWDGGRLPTDAELNNAASAGAEQRHYPWSNPPDSELIDPSYAVYAPNPPALPGGLAVVGSKSPKGDGKWGHADLAGNVWNWALDSTGDLPLPATCDDCAELTATGLRIVRGGSYYLTATWALVSTPYNDDATHHNTTTGVRCARAE